MEFLFVPFFSAHLVKGIGNDYISSFCTFKQNTINQFTLFVRVFVR